MSPLPSSLPHAPDDAMLDRKQRYTQTLLCLIPALCLLLDHPWFPTGIRIVIVGVLVLGMIRWTAAILLFLIQAHWYLNPVEHIAGDGAEILLILLTIMTLMLLSRLRSAQEFTGIRPAIQLIKIAVRGIPEPHASTPVSSPAAVRSFREIVWIAAGSLVAAAAAGLLLQMVPERNQSVGVWGLTPAGMHAIQIGLLLFGIWFVVALPLRELQWKRMTKRQAGVWVRSQFAGWLHRDLRAVERRRRRLQKKREQIQSQVDAVAPTALPPTES